MRRPNLFLVGAPKCGTTAMYRYLEDHPGIYMSPVKEPHFFGSDLRNRYGIQSADEYEGLFGAAAHEKWVGEASVWYLLSTHAAAEIKAYSPEARIVIMLRNPVDMLHSLHAQRLFTGNEDIEEFESALEAESDRMRGDRIPRQCHVVQGLLYRQVVAYAGQVRRYYDAFGRDRVHVIIYDDFQADAAGVYRELMAFLGLECTGEETFGIHNPSKRPRSLAANRLIRKPPMIIRRAVRALLSDQSRKRVGRWLLARTVVREKRPPMDRGLAEQLRRELTPEVRELEVLLDRDLGGWRWSPPSAA